MEIFIVTAMIFDADIQEGDPRKVKTGLTVTVDSHLMAYESSERSQEAASRVKERIAERYPESEVHIAVIPLSRNVLQSVLDQVEESTLDAEFLFE